MDAPTTLRLESIDNRRLAKLVAITAHAAFRALNRHWKRDLGTELLEFMFVRLHQIFMSNVLCLEMTASSHQMSEKEYLCLKKYAKNMQIKYSRRRKVEKGLRKSLKLRVNPGHRENDSWSEKWSRHMTPLSR